MFLLFNHTLTMEQKADASHSLGISEFVEMPPHLQTIWSQVPSKTDTVESHIEPVRQWLEEQARAGDYVLVQGDFGATYQMVCFALGRGLVPVYATTRRHAEEIRESDGTVKKENYFFHQRFRIYKDL